MSNQNLNFAHNVHNNVNYNSEGTLKENLILNNYVNNKNNSNYFSNENLNTFQQKRIIKNYISNNRQNEHTNKNPKIISSFSPTTNSNLNLHYSNNQVNNTIFNLNSNTNNNFNTTSSPNFNQISTQGRNNKPDLKHLLVFSESGNNPNIIEKNNEVNNTSLINLKNKNSDNQKFSFNFNFSDKIDPVNFRVNSESSLANYIPVIDSNKLPIIDIMKHLKYQFSSLDHQKMAMEKLMRSKAKNFCLLISEECSKKKKHVIINLIFELILIDVYFDNAFLFIFIGVQRTL